MATVSGYAATSPGAACAATGDVVNDRAAVALAALLPSGAAWSRDPDSNLAKTTLGLSREFSRLRRRAQRLLSELDPLKARELLADLEHDYGLEAGSLTLAQRRQALRLKMLGSVGQTQDAYRAIAAAAGAPDVTFSGYEVATCVSRCTAPLYDWRWRSAWLTRLPVDTDAATRDAVRDAFLAARQRHAYPLFETAGSAGYGSLASVSGHGSFGSVRAVAYGAGDFVAVGDRGFIAVSSDGGLTWEDRSLAYSGRDLTGVAYCAGAGTWVAVGRAFAAYSSDRGVGWTQVSLADQIGTRSLNAIVAHDNVVVAVGEEWYGVRSSDGGKTWAAILPSGESYPYHFLTATWDATRSLFIVSDSTSFVFSSPDGQNWTSLGAYFEGSDACDLFADHAGKLVMVSTAALYEADYNPEGLSWTYRNPFPEMEGYIRASSTGLGGDGAETQVVLTSRGELAWSNDDRATWQVLTRPTPPQLYFSEGRCLANGDGIWIAFVHDTSFNLNYCLRAVVTARA